MVQEGRAKYADPSSVLRAAVMLLEHIGEIELAKKLDRALDICMVEERKVVVTGRDTGATAQELPIMCWIPSLSCNLHEK